LYLYPHHKIVPTWEIDQVWHHHILDTHKYAQDCQWLFGYFVHHYPYFGQGSSLLEQQEWHQAFAHTCFLFFKHFDVDLSQSEFLQADVLKLSLDLGADSTEHRSLNDPSACIELCQTSQFK
jgi:hypothetical protein